MAELVTLPEAKLRSMMSEVGRRSTEQALTEERALVRPLLVDLVAFVDDEHEVVTNGCHYEPGKDCAVWCDACKLLARVPADVLAEARQQLRERGIDRD